MALSTQLRQLLARAKDTGGKQHGRRPGRRYRSAKEVRRLTGAFRVYVVGIKPYLMAALNAAGAMEAKLNRQDGQSVLMFEIALLVLAAGGVICLVRGAL
jgi:hypothetical protein